jgi:hypothetical protein
MQRRDFLGVLGGAATREQAMADFKAVWERHQRPMHRSKQHRYSITSSALARSDGGTVPLRST